jgi:hypothetical protein
MKNCGTCRNWLYDVTNPQDRGMEAHDMRPCSLAHSTIGGATFMHESTPSCQKYSVTQAIIKKESTQKKIDGFYAALGKERK